MLQFWLKMGGDGTKHCWKMKRMQQDRLVSMGRKRDTRSGVMTSVGGEATLGRGKRVDDTSWAYTNLTRPKNKENPCGQFS
jgi:hypothetical protein